MGPTNTQVLEHAVGELAKRYEMEWRIYYDNKVKRVAILVSKLDHCLYDLLIRLKAGELSCQIPVIISNHPDLAPIAQQFGVAFRWVGLCTFVCMCGLQMCVCCLTTQHTCALQKGRSIVPAIPAVYGMISFNIDADTLIDSSGHFMSASGLQKSAQYC